MKFIIILLSASLVKAKWEFTRWQIFENAPSKEDKNRAATVLSKLLITGHSDPYTFEIEKNPYFEIEKNNTVVLAHPIDREIIDEISLRVYAKDMAGNDIEKPETVRITVMDRNDNPPVFEKKIYVGTVPENSRNDTFVMQVKATDADKQDGYGRQAMGYGDIGYFLPAKSEFFRIDRLTGKIYVNKEGLDREKSTEYELYVEARDGGGLLDEAYYSDTTIVRIQISDQNDMVPQFEQGPLVEVSLREDTLVGPENSDIKKFKVTDKDIGQNGDVTFELTGESASLFGVETILDSLASSDISSCYAHIYPISPLDYETKKEHKFTIRAKNVVDYASSSGIVKSDKMMAELDVLIKVENVNEPPQFEKDIFIFEILENAAPGTKLCPQNENCENGKITAVDPEGDPFRLSIASSDNDGKFKISDDGTLILNDKLDREQMKQYDFDVLAKNVNSNLESKGKVKVLVKDVDDTAPIAMNNTIYFCTGKTVSEPILFSDPDQVSNGDIFAKFAENQNSDNAEIVKNFDIFNSGNILKLTSKSNPVDSDFNWGVKIQYWDKSGNIGEMYFPVQSCDSCIIKDNKCSIEKQKQTGFLIGQSQLWLAVVLAICCSFFALVSFLVWSHNRPQKVLASDVDHEFQKVNEDDIRENICSYNDESGEAPCADSQIGLQTVRHYPNSRLCATLNSKLHKATSEDNFMGAPWDSRLLYKYEGSNSVLNSLSSINSNFTERSLDLTNFEGQKFGLVRQLFHSSVPGSLHRNMTIEMDNEYKYHSLLN